MHGDGDPLAFWRGLMWAIPLSVLMWAGIICGFRVAL